MAKGKATIRSAGGIGESKIFCAPSAEPTGVDILLGCHLNGKLISDLNLDPQILSAISYTATDEGIAASNARENMREPSGITQGKGPFEKSLQQRIAEIKEKGMASYEARDPLREVAEKYAEPGMKPKFLSRKRITENGGTGDYEVVKDKAGDPVSVKGMILGHTPIELADARNKFYQDKAARMLSQVTQKFKEDAAESAVVDQ